MTNYAQLKARLEANLADFEAGMVSFVAAVPLSTGWISREWPVSEGNPARDLLSGAKIALLETGTAWAIGSNRGAAASMRAYIENVFAWLFYKDHSVEFRGVQSGLLELTLPKAVQNYMKSVDRGFEDAYKMLLKAASRSSDYYYGEVSKYVHAHPTFASLNKSIEEIAVASPRDAGFLKICQMADEFISDNYLTHFRGSWDTLPAAVQANATDRLQNKLGKFLAQV